MSAELDLCCIPAAAEVPSAVVSAADLPVLSPALERLRAHVLTHSVKHGTFTLKSGATSTWFLDTKQTACRADGILAVTDAVIEVFGDVFSDIDAIGGLTMGGDPMAYGVAAVAATRGHDLRSFSVRKEAKQGGITGRIAGALIRATGCSSPRTRPRAGPR